MSVTCLHPKIIFNKYLNKHVCVPCGKCDACRSLLANQWANRLELESNAHRYVYFGTLTYAGDCAPTFDMRQLYGLGNDEYDKLFESSLHFLQLWNYCPRVIDYRDFQLFFKSIRNFIYRDYHERIPFSYFIACEYGSTTFHPHAHILLFFDDKRLESSIKSYVYQAWKSKVNTSSFSRFFKSNKWCRVVSSAAHYVAGYINCSSVLPPILTFSEFRQRHHASISPSIGTVGIQQVSLQKFQSGHPVAVSFVRPTTNRIVSLQVWRSLESRFFPRCLSFSVLSVRSRRVLYALAARYESAKTFEEFLKWFLCEWFFSDLSSQEPFSWFAFNISQRIFKGITYPFDVERLRKAFYLSKRVLYFSQVCSVTLESYVSRIEEYYCRKDYDSLCSQLAEQEQLTSVVSAEPILPYLLLSIDPLFYANKRHLPLSTYSAYLEQFQCTNDLSVYAPSHSPSYKESAYLYSKIVSENTKVKVKKDYVSQHPEFAVAYLDCKQIFNYL